MSTRLSLKAMAYKYSFISYFFARKNVVVKMSLDYNQNEKFINSMIASSYKNLLEW